MKKFLTILVALCMVVTMSVTSFAAEKKTTEVTYLASENDGVDSATWNITVPATLKSGTECEIAVEGSWAPYNILCVTADKNVNMYLDGNEKSDYAVVPVTYNAISLAGSYEESVSATSKVTVDADKSMNNIKFGEWVGTLTFYITLDNDADYVYGNISGEDSTVKISSQEELDSAIAALSGEAVYELSEGTYTFYNNSSYAGKQIVFKGTDGVVIDATGLGNEVYGDEITFDNVTVKFPEVSHKGITHTNKVVFNKCTLMGTQTLYAPTVEFNNCVFEGNDGKDIYYVWTYGIANAVFNKCTFNTSGKAILCYTEGTVEANVTLSDCVFNSDKTVSSSKAAVEVGSDNHAQNYNLTFTNCTADDFYANNSTSPLWGNKNSMDTDHLNVVIDGVEVY